MDTTMDVIKDWFRRQFSDPQAVILLVILITGSAIVLFLGDMLAPVLASVVIAYLLEGLVCILERRRVPRLVAVLLVFTSFLVFVTFLLLGLLPLLWQQVGQLVQQLPSMITWIQKELSRLPERYPDYVSQQQILDVMNVLRAELTSLGQRVVTFSVASVRSIITIGVYMVLVPFLVFFLLKDKERIITWLTRFMPEDRSLAVQVWTEVDRQIGNYIRGKVWEILIVWAVSYVAFAILGLQFAMLLSFFIGVSVLIPYIGAIFMTLPVVLIGYFQWGWSSDFGYLVITYVIIQTLDGNILAPLLCSEAVNLHPLAVIVAILVFGGMWGFWGLFFAIPLASLVQAVIHAWPARNVKNVEPPYAPEPAEE